MGSGTVHGFNIPSSSFQLAETSNKHRSPSPASGGGSARTLERSPKIALNSWRYLYLLWHSDCVELGLQEAKSCSERGDPSRFTCRHARALGTRVIFLSFAHVSTSRRTSVQSSRHWMFSYCSTRSHRVMACVRKSKMTWRTVFRHPSAPL
jgi:hypothetical protein